MNLKLANKNPLKRSPAWSSSGSEKYLPWLSREYVAQGSPLCMLSQHPSFSHCQCMVRCHQGCGSLLLDLQVGFLLSLALHVWGTGKPSLFLLHDVGHSKVTHIQRNDWLSSKMASSLCFMDYFHHLGRRGVIQPVKKKKKIPLGGLWWF